MRKLVVFNLVSVDGFFAGLKGDIDWHVTGDEFNQFAIEQTQSFGALLFGRVTYELFESYWPQALTDPKTGKEDRKIAQIIQDMEKIVFSKKLKKVNWKNTKLFHKIDPKEIKKLKNRAGRDMVIFGSGTIVQTLTKLGLIDEYRLMVNPVILGRGKPMFKNVDKLHLKLLKTRIFKSGNVLLYYSSRT